MKDLSEEVVSSATQNRRRGDTFTSMPAAARGSSNPAKKSLPLERVFSDAKTHPFDQIE